MTITKAELTQAIVDGVGLNQREAKNLVEAFFAEISICLSSGNAVRISGFGNFSLRDKAARPGRNPTTGESIPVSVRRVVSFHASSKLKAAVEQQLTPMRATAQR
jgi:integration host factor subunit alpha